MQDIPSTVVLYCRIGPVLQKKPSYRKRCILTVILLESEDAFSFLLLSFFVVLIFLFDFDIKGTCCHILSICHKVTSD